MANTGLPKNLGLQQGDFRRRYAHCIEPDLNSGCHLWSGSASTAGYGTLTWAMKSCLAHRCAFEDVHGVGSADGIVIRHWCDTPRCVNDLHLIGGTYKENNEDAWSRGRMKPVRGIQINTAVMTEEMVLLAREMARGGLSVTEITRSFPIHRNAMEALIKGQTWIHLPGAIPFPVIGKPGRRCGPSQK